MSKHRPTPEEEQQRQHHQEVNAQHELEQHEVQEVLNFLKRYGRTITAVAAALAIAFMAFQFFRVRARRMEHAARTTLVNGTGLQDWQRVAEQYPDTDAAPLAGLAIAREHYNSGSVDQAREWYNRFLQKHPDHELAPVGEMGLAHCMEADGDYEAAAGRYGQLADRFPEHYIVPICLLGRGRCFEELGRLDQARAAYRKLRDHPDFEADWGARAEAELMRLGD